MSTARPPLVTRAALTIPLTAAVVWLGSQVLALRNSVDASAAATAAPTAVAVVNISAVFDQLKSGAKWSIQLTQLTSASNEEGTAKRANIDRMKKELDAETDPAKRDAIIDSLALAQLELEEWTKLKQLEIDREAGLMWTNMYRMIRQEAQKIAQSSGYDLVVVDDSHTEVNPSRNVNAPMEVQAKQLIATLNVLYAAKAIDITDQVIVQINNKS